MRTVRSLVVAGIAGLALTSAAFATDLYTEVTPAPVMDQGGFDWEGFYLGVGIEYATFDGGAFSEFHVSKHVGYNFDLGSGIILGVEGYASVWTTIGSGEWDWNAGIEKRLGVLVSPDVLLYGAIGVMHYETGNNYATFGGGAEFVVADPVTLDVEYAYENGLNNANTGHRIGVSLNWHM